MKPYADAPILIRSTCPTGLVRVNRAFTDLVGLRAEDLAGRPLLEWIHPHDREKLAQALEAGSGQLTARHESKVDGWRCFEWRISSYGDDVVAFGQPGARPEPASQNLGGSKAETMPQTLDAMARIVETKNPGMRCSILLIDDSGTRVTVGAGPSLPDAYNAAVEGLNIGPTVGSCGTAAFWNVPIVVEDIFNDPLWVELRPAAEIAGVAACWSQPILATDGRVLGAMALYNDEPKRPTQSQMDGLEIAAHMVGLAVERDRLEHQLRESAKMEALGVLAGGIAHDFNNMLAAILGNADLITSDLPLDHDARPMLGSIRTTSLRAADLCKQMLAYAGRGAMSPDRVDCVSLIKELGAILEVALSKKVELEYNLASEPLGVSADRNQLRQVLMNLFTNASEAIGDQEGRVVVSAHAERFTQADLERHTATSALSPGEYVVLGVRDNGAGMSPEVQARIFDPFYSTKSGGRGLGLATVPGVVDRHDGAIILDSREGKGTKFTVLLPRARIPEAEAEAPPLQPATAEGAHILVVDDEPDVRDTTSKILTRAGYTVTCAKDGEEALQVFRADADGIDCVLLDLSMPKLDGGEVFERLRAIRDETPVVLSSGFTEQQVLDRFKGTGLAGVVQKPAPQDVLLSTVGAALRK